MPLTLEVTKEEAGITVYCPELDLVTCGDTLEEARENLASAVEEYYLYLFANQDQLDQGDFLTNLADEKGVNMQELENAWLRTNTQLVQGV